MGGPKAVIRANAGHRTAVAFFPHLSIFSESANQGKRFRYFAALELFEHLLGDFEGTRRSASIPPPQSRSKRGG